MKLDLSKHCIQTELKRLYNRKVSRYFKLKAEDLQLETELELLKAALENLDFPHLRSAHPVLAGGHEDGAAELAVEDGGRITVRVNGREVA